MRTAANTLFVMTQGAYLGRDHLTLKVRVERKTTLRVPVHHLQGVVCFGRVTVSPAVYEACAEHGVTLSFLTATGRFLATVETAAPGSARLRRVQYQQSADPTACLAVARPIVAGKLQNARLLLLRSAREAPAGEQVDSLRRAAGTLAAILQELPTATDLNTLRGLEGQAARAYFDAFNGMLRRPPAEFRLNGRTRRPPLDRVNALLSFVYALVRHDCTAALLAAGLDPAIGFLHAERPGRLSLALDLMEEFRALIADRLVVALINRRQVAPNGFSQDPAGAVSMDEPTRKAVVAAYAQRKREEVRHPLLEESVPIALLPHVQARLLARTLRGELPEYPALVLR